MTKLPYYHCCSLCTWMRTHSKRYLAGSRRNKPKFGTSKRKRGVPFWMHKH